MRRILTAAAALAVCGLIASVSARAEPVHYAGGPMAEGKLCWISTNNDLGYGYWRACPGPAPKMKRAGKKK